MNQRVRELNRRNNELDKKVTEENQEALTDMICYLRGANISEYDQELVRQDLLEMVLSAQERGEDIRAVIGGDYKEFCDSIIANLPPRTMKQKLVDFFDVMGLCLAILVLINTILADETPYIIKNLLTGKAVDWKISISLGDIAASILIIAAAVMLVQYIMKTSFQKDGKKKGSILKGALAGVVVVAVFVLIAWFGRAVAFKVNLFAALAAVVVLWGMHKVMERI